MAITGTINRTDKRRAKIIIRFARSQAHIDKFPIARTWRTFVVTFESLTFCN